MENKSSLEISRFVQKGEYASFFLRQYQDPKCKQIVNPDVANTNLPPSFCKECVQLYCYDCHKTYKIKKCLTCGQPLILQKAPNELLQPLFEFEVYCPNSNRGCKSTFSLKSQHKHLQKCLYAKKRLDDDDDDNFNDDQALIDDQNNDPDEQLGHIQDVELVKEEDSEKMNILLKCNKKHNLYKLLTYFPDQMEYQCNSCQKTCFVEDGGHMICDKCPNKYKLCPECETAFIKKHGASGCLNPRVELVGAIINLTCDQGHLLQRTKKLYKFNKYECYICRKKHLDAKEIEAYHCDKCQYDICAVCFREEYGKLMEEIAKKQKEKTLCSSCSKTIKSQETEGLGSISCPNENHELITFTQIFRGKKCTLCQANGIKMNCDVCTQIDYNLCENCVNEAKKTLNLIDLQNAIIEDSVCPQGHYLAKITGLFHHSCDLCRRSIDYREEVMRCDRCDFDVCSACTKTYRLKEKPLVFTCCNGHDMIRCYGVPSWSYQYTFTCLVCRRAKDTKSNFGYRCSYCSSSESAICIDCINTYFKTIILKEKSIASFISKYICPNRHYLVKVAELHKLEPKYISGRYYCDVCRANNTIANDIPFHCQTCLFDVCGSCYQTASTSNPNNSKVFKEIMEEKKKAEEEKQNQELATKRMEEELIKQEIEKMAEQERQKLAEQEKQKLAELEKQKLAETTQKEPSTNNTNNINTNSATGNPGSTIPPNNEINKTPTENRQTNKDTNNLIIPKTIDHDKSVILYDPKPNILEKKNIADDDDDDSFDDFDDDDLDNTDNDTNDIVSKVI